MPETKRTHTPGPWKATMHPIGQDDRWFIQFGEPIWGGLPTIASLNSDCLSYSNAEADAHLIAAAPELYEALSMMVQTFSQIGVPTDKWPVANALQEVAKTALEKANPNKEQA